MYTVKPELYDALANDRDFAEEAKLLASYVSKNEASSLELMAGPARHSFHLKKSSIDAFAVDSSEGMARFAVTSGFVSHDRYAVSDCLEFLHRSNRQFSLILLLRYGLGYISPLYLNDFFALCRKNLEEAGVLILDLHRFGSVVSGLNSLDIRERHFQLDGDDYLCRWPSGEIYWQDDCSLAEMVVEIECTNSKERFFYLSSEYIYDASIIAAIALAQGISISRVPHQDDGVIRVLGRKI